jgi:hypothetical protein
MRAEDVVINDPCEQDWDGMRPEAGGQRRWCEHCERSVHDLSEMEEPAALALLRATAGRDVCISYVEDKDGEIVFGLGQNIVPLEHVRRRPRAQPVIEIAKLASAASIAMVLGACTPHGKKTIRIDESEPIVEQAPIPRTEERKLGGVQMPSEEREALLAAMKQLEVEQESVKELHARRKGGIKRKLEPDPLGDL